MKNRLPFLSLFILLFVSSCTTYQILTVSSKDLSQTKPADPFVFDNDTLHLEYTISGNQGLVNIKIQNKLDKPLYIDWNSSAIIADGKTKSMTNRKIPIDGTAITQTSRDYFSGIRGDKDSTSNINLNAALPQNIDFIAPKSYITKQTITILDKHLDNINIDTFLTKKIFSTAMNSEVSIKEASYSDNISTHLSFQHI